MGQQGPDTAGLAHQRQEKAVTVCRDVLQGTLHMRRQATKYLPMFPKEQVEDYSRRLNEAVLFNGYRRTLKGLVGLVLSKEIKQSDDIPQQIAGYLENVDLEGRDVNEFAIEHFEDALADGHACIFVDLQEVEEGAVQSLFEEQAMGLRPYWIALRKQQTRKFSTIRINGRRVLSLLRWIETAEEDDGRWGEKEVRRVREYRLASLTDDAGNPRLGVQWRIYEEVKDGPGTAKWMVRRTGTLGKMDEIPLATTYTNRTGYLESDPPMLDLALENVKHWQKRSDKDNVEHAACVPIFVTKGVDRDEIKGFSIGPTVGMALPQKDQEAEYVEIAGAGIEAARLSIKDIEYRMAVLGLSMLMSETRQAETATSKRIDKAESDAQLIMAARNLQSALNEAKRLTAKWDAIDDVGTLEVNRDFERRLLDPQMASVLLQAVESGKLSEETFWEALKRGEVLNENFDPELEATRLEGGGDSQMLAQLKNWIGQQSGQGAGDAAA